MSRAHHVFVVLALLTARVAATWLEPLENAPMYGTVAFDSSLAAGSDARAWFDYGLALLHCFEYDAASAAFVHVQTAAPGSSVGYTMDALTSFHFIWLEENQAHGRAALARRAAAGADSGNELERALLSAVEALVDSRERGTDAATRVGAFNAALGTLAAVMPDNVEVRAFVALGALGGKMHGTIDADEWGAEWVSRLVALLSVPLLGAYPNHPGLAHYLVHVTDSAAHAPAGVWAASRLGSIAPHSGHMIHMASHIWFHLGEWALAEAANAAAWTLSLARDMPDWHSADWLHYAMLLRGRFTSARALIAQGRSLAPQTGRETAHAAWLALLQARQLAEEGANLVWDPELLVCGAPSYTCTGKLLSCDGCTQEFETLLVDQANAATVLATVLSRWAQDELDVSSSADARAVANDARSALGEIVAGERSDGAAVAAVSLALVEALVAAPQGSSRAVTLGPSVRGPIVAAVAGEGKFYQFEGPPGLVVPAGAIGATIVLALPHAAIDWPWVHSLLVGANATTALRPCTMLALASTLLELERDNEAVALVAQLRHAYAAAEVNTSAAARNFVSALDKFDSSFRVRQLTHKPNGFVALIVGGMLFGLFACVAAAYKLVPENRSSIYERVTVEEPDEEMDLAMGTLARARTVALEVDEGGDLAPPRGSRALFFADDESDDAVTAA